jgi:transcriptional regulator with XRE-family HTH domain
MATTLGERLKNVRKRKNISIDGAADALNISYDDLVSYEQGKRSPSETDLAAFADFYNVKLSYLKEGNVFIDHTNDLLQAFSKLDLQEQHDFIALFSTIRKPNKK